MPNREPPRRNGRCARAAFLAACVIISSGGCTSMVVRSLHGDGGRDGGAGPYQPYEGTGVATDALADPSTWNVGTIALAIDTPLTAVADTVLLPWDLAERNEPSEPPRPTTPDSERRAEPDPAAE